MLSSVLATRTSAARWGGSEFVRRGRIGRKILEGALVQLHEAGHHVLRGGSRSAAGRRAGSGPQESPRGLHPVGKDWAISTNAGSLSTVSAWSGVLLGRRRAVQASRVGGVKVRKSGYPLVRFWYV